MELQLRIQGWTRVGTLLPIISHRSNASTMAEPSSDSSSLRASFNRQALKTETAPPARHVYRSVPDDQPMIAVKVSLYILRKSRSLFLLVI